MNIDPPQIIDAINNQPMHWHALFANQRTAYYDISALRHNDWCPEDCWTEVTKAATFPWRKNKRTRALRRYVYGRQYWIPTSRSPIQVDLAFGGFAVYKRGILKDCWYGSRAADGSVVCEHVSINKQICEKNGRNISFRVC